MDKSFYIHIFHEFIILYFGNLHILLIDTHFAGTGRKNDNVNDESKEYNSSCQIITVANVPGLLFKFNIHSAFIVLQFIIRRMIWLFISLSFHPLLLLFSQFPSAGHLFQNHKVSGYGEYSTGSSNYIMQLYNSVGQHLFR